MTPNLNLNEWLQKIPAKYRQWIYVGIAVVVFLYGVWQATEGNWKAFLTALGTAFMGSLANANLTKSAPVEPTEDNPLD